MVDFTSSGLTDSQIYLIALIAIMLLLAVAVWLYDRIATRHWREHERRLDELRKLYPPDDS